ncbi:MAG: HNH endonuclease [Firmicutes bacterium]|nr:HNH endonuclease [Bacillota bacterium]
MAGLPESLLAALPSGEALVPVVDPRGRPLTPCTVERARQNLEDGLATWEAGVLRLNYHPLAYRRVYRKVLKRDGYVCAWCGGVGSTLDHVIPLSWGGRTEPDNCVVACRACNHSRNNALPSRFAAMRGLRIRHPVILRVLAREDELVAEAERSLLSRPISTCVSREEAQVWLAYHQGHPERVHPEPPGEAPATRLKRGSRPFLTAFLP